jgi:hypothetical protein
MSTIGGEHRDACRNASGSWDAPKPRMRRQARERCANLARGALSKNSTRPGQRRPRPVGRCASVAPSRSRGERRASCNANGKLAGGLRALPARWGSRRVSLRSGGYAASSRGSCRRQSAHARAARRGARRGPLTRSSWRRSRRSCRARRGAGTCYPTPMMATLDSENRSSLPPGGRSWHDGSWVGRS